MAVRKSSTKPAVTPSRHAGAPENETPGEQRFHSTILAALEAEPVEDGYRHPAEEMLSQALRSTPGSAPAWIQSLFAATTLQRPTMAAALIQCLGRLPRKAVEPWGLALTCNGLQHRNVELRDAAAGAIERWEDPVAAQALLERAVVEPVPWLAQYMRDVATDLADVQGATGR